MNAARRKRISAAVTLWVVLCAAGAAPAQQTTGAFRVERNVVYATADNVELQLDAYVPAGGEATRPAVLVVHGGAWRRGNKRKLTVYAIALARRGYVAFAIDYRLAPMHRFPAQIEDCRSAVRWIRKNAVKYRIDTNRIGAIGYSAGGHLVTLLGCTSNNKRHKGSRVDAVVAGGAPCDFRKTPERSRGLSYWLGGTRHELPEVYTAASPAAFVTAAAPPMFFFHGADDRLVKRSSPTAMVKTLLEAKAEASIHIVPGGSHFSTAANREALGKAWTFFDKHLKSKPMR